MGKDRHRLSENKIGIYYDKPQWCWRIPEETRHSVRTPGTVAFVLLFIYPYCYAVRVDEGLPSNNCCFFTSYFFLSLNQLTLIFKIISAWSDWVLNRTCHSLLVSQLSLKYTVAGIKPPGKCQLMLINVNF